MKYDISTLTAMRVIKGLLLCSLFALGINELSKAGTADDPEPTLQPPVHQPMSPHSPPPPSPPRR